MTPSVPDALVPLALRLIHANRAFVTADGARKRIRERELRPEPYGPPSRLRPGVRVDVERVDGWPVYTIVPKDVRGGTVFVHGGGWVNEIATQHWHLAARIAGEASVAVTVPIYPLIPFGTAQDARDGVRSLVLRNLERYGTTCLAGDSAGGQIALSTALSLRDEGITLPQTALISPALDLSWSNPQIPVVQPTDPWLATPGGRILAEHWRGDLDLLDPAVSPLFGDLAGLGPLSIFTGTRDVLNPDARLLAEKAAAAGVSIELHEAVGQVHVYPLLPPAQASPRRARWSGRCEKRSEPAVSAPASVTNMRHGIVILPQDDWPAAARRWQQAEEYGFDHAWTYDHLSWRGLAGERWHATVPTLTAAATVTSRIELGLFVASPNFRHPVPFAKELATLDDIAGGRLLIGVGSGGTGFDAFVLGQPELTPRERYDRFVEFVDALDLLLRFENPGSGGVSFAGEWFTAHEARMLGRPAREPRAPLLLAGNGPKAIRHAATHGDGWVTTGGNEDDREDWWSGVAALARRFDDAYVASGRNHGVTRTLSLDNEQFYSLSSAAAYEDSVARAEALGFTDVVAHWPREHGLYAGDESVLQEVAATFPQS